MNRTATNSSLEIHDLDASAPETIEGGSESGGKGGGRRRRLAYRRLNPFGARVTQAGSAGAASTGYNDGTDPNGNMGN